MGPGQFGQARGITEWPGRWGIGGDNPGAGPGGAADVVTAGVGARLADRLLRLGTNLDLAILSNPVPGAFTRFLLGDPIADGLGIAREPIWDPLLRLSWGPFVAVREGILTIAPPAQEAYWLFDEFLRQFALWYLAELRMPISIEAPTANRDMTQRPR